MYSEKCLTKSDVFISPKLYGGSSKNIMNGNVRDEFDWQHYKYLETCLLSKCYSDFWPKNFLLAVLSTYILKFPKSWCCYKRLNVCWKEIKENCNTDVFRGPANAKYYSSVALCCYLNG